MKNKFVSTNWNEFILKESKEPYFIELMEFIDNEYKQKTIFPEKDKIFRAFDFFNIEDTVLVILGQDPYYKKGMADGLAFSCANNIIPKSLKNIFNELKYDLNIFRENADLTDIAMQNVLLLNTCLTVEENKPLSHKNKGWEIFIDKVIKYINDNCKDVIFLLMGNESIQKEKLLTNQQYIIKTSHPSPLSYKKSFYHSKPFSKINQILENLNKKKINW